MHALYLSMTTSLLKRDLRRIKMMLDSVVVLGQIAEPLDASLTLSGQ